MDKNHNQILEDNFIRKIKEFSKRNPNIILSSNPFHKCQFLIDLMNFVEFPVIFLDFDLLYSGYIKSKIIQTNEKVMIYQPKKENWMDIQKEIIIKLSKKKNFGSY